MIDALRDMVQLFVFLGLTFGPWLIYARWLDRHRIAAVEAWRASGAHEPLPRRSFGQFAPLVIIGLLLLGGGFFLAMLAVPSAHRFFG